MTQTVPDSPFGDSMQEFAAQLRKSSATHLYAYTLGVVEAIVGNATTTPSTKVAKVVSAIAACNLVQAERQSADASGLTYSREPDEADDPTPVSPARGGQPHVVAMTDGGLVDETPAEAVTVYFSFGHGQADPDTGKDLLDHYVTVVGPSYDACRKAMFASKYGERWAFEYPDDSPATAEWIPQWTEHERIVLPVSEAR